MPTAGSQPEVAQVLVEIDAREQWTQHSLELLCDARAVAGRLNGTAAGWVLTGLSKPLPAIRELAGGGCRRLRHLKHERFSAWSSEAIAAALAACLPPESRLILLPGTPRGEEVAALLGARLRTSWIPDALTLSTTRSGAVEISAVLPGGKLSRSVRVPGDRAVVVTMRPGVAEVRTGPGEALEVEEIRVDLDRVAPLTRVEGFIAADPQSVDLAFADRIVSAGRGTGGPEGVALVAALAETLGASLGGSRLAVDFGWIPPARQVGQTGRTVAPDLYVACGISGASHHLVGMRQSKHIVAINSDPKAPIHDLAHLSLRADLRAVIPSIIASLKKRPKPPAGLPR